MGLGPKLRRCIEDSAQLLGLWLKPIQPAIYSSSHIPSWSYTGWSTMLLVGHILTSHTWSWKFTLCLVLLHHVRWWFGLMSRWSLTCTLVTLWIIYSLLKYIQIILKMLLKHEKYLFDVWVIFDLYTCVIQIAKNSEVILSLNFSFFLYFSSTTFFLLFFLNKHNQHILMVTLVVCGSEHLWRWCHRRPKWWQRLRRC